MIYWDHNSTTPCSPEVVEAMRPFWNEKFGNPASPHLMGRRAAAAVRKAREQVAALANASPSEIVFTSGATESNNLLFLGVLLAPRSERKRIIVSAIEHKSVLDPAGLLEQHGFELIVIPVNSDGVTDIEAANRLINNETLLVSVQAANNELGTIQPVAELAAIAHRNGAYFHTDAVQALGKIPFDVEQINCDFASFSAHKLYGPKGIGALYVRGGVRRWPWAYPFRGGGQEAGLRPGTSNVPGIVGFGKACEIAANIGYGDFSGFLIEYLREKMDGEFLVHSLNVARLPGVYSIAFLGIPSDLLIDHLHEIAISNGAACSSGAVGISPVLAEIGCDRNIAKSTVRISIGKHCTVTEIKLAVDALASCIREIKELI